MSHSSYTDDVDYVFNLLRGQNKNGQSNSNKKIDITQPGTSNRFAYCVI